MITPRLFTIAQMTVTLLATACFFGPQKANAQDGGISVGSVKFGAKPDDKWLKVDLKSIRRSTGGPTVGLGSSAVRSTSYSSPSTTASRSVVSTTPVVFQKATTRVRNSKLLTAAGIAMHSAHAHSTGSCWRYVKSALLKAEVIDSYPKTGYAKQAASELVQDYGFVRTTISNPFSAPVGSVLVYGGSGAGHIEIRTLDGFVSDFVSAKPSKRPLLGVYVK